VRLFTRNGNDWTSRLKPLRDEVRALGLPSAGSTARSWC
jgi:ATP-dependent DNA ligase